MFIVGEHMGYIDFFSFKSALLINSLSEWCDNFNVIKTSFGSKLNLNLLSFHTKMK